MIKVGVFYPQSEKFDWDYYLNRHTPLIQKLLAPALKKVDIEKGIAGGAPGTAATYQTVCNLHFDSVEVFQTAFTRMQVPSWATSPTTQTPSRLCRLGK